MTLFLPNNFSPLSIGYYIFAYNATHVAMPLDYGSLLNHHESTNAEAVGVSGCVSNVYFRVRRGFLFANHNVSKVCCIYT